MPKALILKDFAGRGNRKYIKKRILGYMACRRCSTMKKNPRLLDTFSGRRITRRVAWEMNRRPPARQAGPDSQSDSLIKRLCDLGHTAKISHWYS